MKKTGLVLAATAAALFVAGCATEADTSANAVQPAPIAQPVDHHPTAKDLVACKTLKVKKHHAKKHHAASTTETTTTTTTTDAAAQQ